MYKRLAIAALGAMSIPGLGFATYPALHAFSGSPGPQVVIPAAIYSSVSGTDDPANHDANHIAGADDPANHEVADVAGADDRADHDSDDIAVLGTTSPGITLPPKAPAATPTTVSRGDDRLGRDVGDDNDVDPVTAMRSGQGPGSSTSASSDDSRQSGGPGSGGGDSRGSSGNHSGGSDDGPGHH